MPNNIIDNALNCYVHSVKEIGPRLRDGSVRILELKAVDNGTLPYFEAGAHIDIILDNGISRQYSLFNKPGNFDAYYVAVALDANSRGGSKYIHESIKIGDKLRISTPRCHFKLNEDSEYSILIAGGIGVTPLWAMAQKLIEIGKKFAFYYGARSYKTAPLLDIIEPALKEKGIRLETFFADDGIEFIDIPSILTSAPKGTNFYACGPSGMLDVYIEAGKNIPTENLHYERFNAAETGPFLSGFEVKLARTGGVYTVEQGQTILQTLKDNGINVAHSCSEGVCGACETKIIEGIADHRDSILSDAEKAEGKTMMVCCSGAKTPLLVLDL